MTRHIAVLLVAATAGLFPLALGTHAEFNAGSGERSSTSFVLVDSLGSLSGGLQTSGNWLLSAGPLAPDFVLPSTAAERTRPDYQIVRLYSKVVTAGTGDLNNAFYIEDVDGFGGIRVDRGTLTWLEAERGDWVDVQGPLFTSPGGERYIRLQTLTRRFNGQPGPPVWGVSGSGMGGAPAGSAPGVESPRGPNNVGLLVRTWGAVTHVDPAGQFFYVDSGERMDDGSGIPGALGVRVALTGLASGNAISAPAVGEWVQVKGISSTMKINGHIVRLLRPRCQEDITTVHG